MIYILHGPPASGKTMISEQLKQKLGCTRILEDWNEGELRSGDLAITNLHPSQFTVPNGAMVISITEAKRIVNPKFLKRGAKA